MCSCICVCTCAFTRACFFSKASVEVEQSIRVCVSHLKPAHLAFERVCASTAVNVAQVLGKLLLCRTAKVALIAHKRAFIAVNTHVALHVTFLRAAVVAPVVCANANVSKRSSYHTAARAHCTL